MESLFEVNSKYKGVAPHLGRVAGSFSGEVLSS
jgi:hypothetical protein